MDVPQCIQFPSGPVVGTFPNRYNYSIHDMEQNLNQINSSLCQNFSNDTTYANDSSRSFYEKPKILLMGLKGSGKSSIQKVVFHKMLPNETFHLGSTHAIMKDDLSDMSFIRFQVWDVPGHIDLSDENIDSAELFSNSVAIIFVIDGTDDYSVSLGKLHELILHASKYNTTLRYEVFIHKVDCLTDEQKIDTQRDISQRVYGFLNEDHPRINIGYHLTTIYDHSIFESFSKVVQKLLPHMEAFENLLNLFIESSLLEKAFLFDVASHIYLATDSNIVDMQIYELCCDMIDVVVDIASIYNPRSEFDSYFSERTSSCIKLDNETVLYLRGINKHLALACTLREESLEKLGIIDYNFQCIKKGLLDILELKPTSKAEEKINSSTPTNKTS